MIQPNFARILSKYGKNLLSYFCITVARSSADLEYVPTTYNTPKLMAKIKTNPTKNFKKF